MNSRIRVRLMIVVLIGLAKSVEGSQHNETKSSTLSDALDKAAALVDKDPSSHDLNLLNSFMTDKRHQLGNGKLQTKTQHTHVDETLEKMQAEIDELKSSLKTVLTMCQNVPQKRSVLAEPQVAFYAQSTHGRINVGEHQTIVFDQVVTNVGNAYNKFSGMFTAPVSGTYAIFWSTFNGHHTHLLSELVHNANVVGLAWSDAYDHDDGEMASNQAVLPMNAGDIAYVRSAPYNPPCVADGRSFTTFSGWLLYLA